jgi:hypothetical protein
VFANCSEGVTYRASTGKCGCASGRIAYQIAAANFYAGNFDEAKSILTYRKDNLTLATPCSLVGAYWCAKPAWAPGQQNRR